MPSLLTLVATLLSDDSEAVSLGKAVKVGKELFDTVYPSADAIFCRNTALGRVRDLLLYAAAGSVRSGGIHHALLLL